MDKDKKPDNIEAFLEEVDKFKAGDKNAFEGMTIQLDGDAGDDDSK